MAKYANPDALVETEWLAERLDDPKFRIIEVDEDTTAYEKGHIRRSIGWNWFEDRHAKPRRELMAPAHLPQEQAQVPGHIPSAANVPWSKAANEDGTFKSADELTGLYEGANVLPGKDVIAYCRIGERSAHTWFVLHELLGYKDVKNYDGSWTEWGSSIRVPIEK